jgi:ATP-dependent Clp protease, protease subunit
VRDEPGPFPGEPPDRPRWADDLPGALRARLLDQRVVVVAGPLDDALANRAAAELMTLDATGDGPIELRLDSSGGDLDPVFVLIDTIEVVGVPVQVTCLGRVEGPVVGVVAVADHRRAAPHTRFRLCEPDVSLAGSPSRLEAWAEHHRRRVARFGELLAGATGRPRAEVAADLSSGRYLDAEQALDYGLIDEIWPQGADIRRLPGPGRTLGYRSPR